MKILHVANWYPSNIQEKRAIWIRDQIELLPEVDHEVWHLEVVYGPLPKVEFQHVSDRERSLILHFPTKRWFVIEILTSLLLTYLLFFKLSLNTFSHLHFHIAYPLLTYWHWLRKFVDKPVLVSEHWSAYHYNFHIPIKKKRRRIERIFFNPMTLLTVSEALAQDIKKFSGNEFLSTRVIPNVVDLEIFQYADISHDPSVYFMVSQWKDPKDPFVILSVLPSVPDIFLRIGGYGPQMDEMKKMSESLGIAKRVEFIGAMTKEEIAFQMNKCHGFIQSSHYETFSVVCAEAIACGCPVIASAVGGIVEFIDEDNGVLVSEQTEDSWRSALTQFRNRSWSRSSISQSAHKRFARSELSSRLRAVYSEKQASLESSDK